MWLKPVSIFRVMTVNQVSSGEESSELHEIFAHIQCLLCSVKHVIRVLKLKSEFLKRLYIS